MNINRSGQLDLRVVKFLEDDTLPRLHVGDVLFNNTNSPELVGKTTYISESGRFAFSNHMTQLRPSSAVNGRYLASYLHHLWSLGIFQQLCTNHVNQASVGRGALERILVPLPPLAAQRGIVAEIEKQFTRLDAAIGSLKHAQSRLKTFRASVRATHVNDVAWPMMPLGAVIDGIEAGKNFKCEERPPYPDEVGVAKVSAVTWGTYDELASKTCHEKARFEARYLIRPGDFLFTRANTLELVGACVIVGAVARKIMLSDKVLRIKLRDVEPRWVLHSLQSNLGRTQIEALATGNQLSMRNISQKNIARIEIPRPPRDEQIKLVALIERALSFSDSIGGTIEASLRRADRLRQSLLKRAFAGKLVPEDGGATAQ